MSNDVRYTLTIRAGHPDFLDLPWQQPLGEWRTSRLVALPMGPSRHPVRHLRYGEAVYVVKEIPAALAQREYQVLSGLERDDLVAVQPVGLVEGRRRDPGEEASAALITRYLPFTFSYHELLQGAAFGAHREALLDAFAGLLVELHIAGCFWGDCSLSNVLLRRDGDGLDTIMVDAETAVLHDGLSPGRRGEDLALMVENVAGGMADIAASQGLGLDDADLWLGEDIAARYHELWGELFGTMCIGPGEHDKIDARVQRVHELGFDIESLELEPMPDSERLRVEIRPGRRRFHARRLASLTGLEVSEGQARHILADMYYYRTVRGTAVTDDDLAAIEWRAFAFEPMLERLRALDGVTDPVQSYCELLVHRYLRSAEAGHDIGTEAAFEDWCRRRLASAA
ncbi:DUF4032 domain-containing protein [Haliangium sp.]|uniref:DUF4032 domain-containing protein n=1 Tax=Haliangium sp. TaxID=2663208 RepID=UPI003D13F80D